MREGQGRWRLKLVAAGRDEKPEKPRDSEGDRENGRSGMMETEMEIPGKK